MGARPYSKAFRDRMVERLTGAGAPTAVDLSVEVGVPQPTLSRWVRNARSFGGMTKKKPPEGAAEHPPSGPDREPRSTREWTPAEKLRVVAAAAQSKEDELGELLRREGIHVAQLEEWRAEILSALGSPPARGKDPNARRVRELERELARKDKALAEVTALLVLRKKLNALFGDSAEEGDSTNEDNEKK
jgi:transposase